MHKRLFGYTLTEVVITMLIISVIAGVSIGVTKKKFNHITSYTYYTAYKTLDAAVGEILYNFKPNNPDYINTFNILDRDLWNKFAIYIRKIFIPEAIARAEEFMQLEDCIKVTVSGCCITSCDPGYKFDNNLCECTPNAKCEGVSCTYPEYLDENTCTCKTRNHLDDEILPCLTMPICTGNRQPDYNLCKCLCPIEQQSCKSDEIFDFNACECIKVDPKDCTEPENGCGADKEWSSTLCKCIPKPGCTEPEGGCGTDEYWDDDFCQCMRDCSIEPNGGCGDNKHWDEASCSCEPNGPDTPDGPDTPETTPTPGVVQPTTIPRTGNKFCAAFVEVTNTNANAISGGECRGSKITNSTTNFANKKPDMVLRNGMRIYNLSRQNPNLLGLLNNNGSGVTYKNSAGEDIDIDEYGYTIYIDIDGKSGNSILFEDVLPFYVTLSGKVIPIYDPTYSETPIGGNSREHLAVSISKENTNADGTVSNIWVRKSLSFKEAACGSGFVSQVSRYCLLTPRAQRIDECSGANSGCELHIITPLKWFNW